MLPLLRPRLPPRTPERAARTLPPCGRPRWTSDRLAPAVPTRTSQASCRDGKRARVAERQVGGDDRCQRPVGVQRTLRGVGAPQPDAGGARRSCRAGCLRLDAPRLTLSTCVLAYSSFALSFAGRLSVRVCPRSLLSSEGSRVQSVSPCARVSCCLHLSLSVSICVH